MTGGMRFWLAAVLGAAPFWLGGADFSKGEIAASSRAYFAPLSSFSCWRMRMPDGFIREFSPTGARVPEGLAIDSEDGWTGYVRDDIALVRTPKGQKPQLEWGFRNGTLMMLAVDGNPYGLEYPEPVIYADESPVPLWPEADELKAADVEIHSAWDRGRRLRLWFGSPNRAGTFLSFFALLALSAALRVRRKAARVAALLASLAVLVPLGMTDSRGALLGFACGAALLVVAAARRWKVTRRQALLMGAALLAVLALSVAWMRVASPRSLKSYGRSDATRHQILAAVPQMFAAAPGGWGRYGLVGRAYFDWFEQSRAIDPKINLVSDHLTRFLGAGWLGGGFYVFCWSAGLLLLLLFALRGFSALPVALWTSLGVAAGFNLIFSDWEIWVLPLASLFLLVRARPKRFGRMLAASAAGGVLAAGCAVGGMLAVASLQRPLVPSVTREGPRFLVGGGNPRIWVVDDNQSLGHVMAAKEIRFHYQQRRSAEAIGYVRSLADLPAPERVRVLVLAGRRGQEFLERHAAGALPPVLPQAVVFLSPCFGPEAIPAALHERTSVSVLIGEFAARYYRGYEKQLPGVKVVAGAEQYIPGWMRYLVK